MRSSKIAQNVAKPILKKQCTKKSMYVHTTLNVETMWDTYECIFQETAQNKQSPIVRI
jgi:hypothetical protein